MKYLSTIIIFVLLLTTSDLLAQDTTQLPLKKSKFALQVQIPSLQYLRPFQGNTLSCKYHISDLSAVRLGFSISNSDNFYNVKNDKAIGKERSFDFELNAQFVQYIKTEDDVALFWGCGPSYGKRVESEYTGYRKNNWNLGVEGVLGIEWFFKRNMSLSIEYGLEFYYTESRYSDYYYPHKGNIVKSFGTSSQNMFKVGVSLYI